MDALEDPPVFPQLVVYALEYGSAYPERIFRCLARDLGTAYTMMPSFGPRALPAPAVASLAQLLEDVCRVGHPARWFLDRASTSGFLTILTLVTHYTVYSRCIQDTPDALQLPGCGMSRMLVKEVAASLQFAHKPQVCLGRSHPALLFSR